MREEFEKFLSKKVRITLISGMNFTGRVISINDNTLSLIDKFSMNVTIRLADISLINEVLNG